jgi:predicted XRE-type DNA-binding protein
MTFEKSSGNIFEDAGFSRVEAANLVLRSELMTEVRAIIEKEGLTQAQAAKRLGITQPKVSNLMNGHISKFTIDKLVNMLSMAGRKTNVKVVRDKGALRTAV